MMRCALSLQCSRTGPILAMGQSGHAEWGAGDGTVPACWSRACRRALSSAGSPVFFCALCYVLAEPEQG
jgi:hypothetical protein